MARLLISFRIVGIETQEERQGFLKAAPESGPEVT
jgi:hypothetical protein